MGYLNCFMKVFVLLLFPLLTISKTLLIETKDSTKSNENSAEVNEDSSEVNEHSAEMNEDSAEMNEDSAEKKEDDILEKDKVMVEGRDYHGDTKRGPKDNLNKFKRHCSKVGNSNNGKKKKYCEKWHRWCDKPKHQDKKICKYIMKKFMW